MWVKPWPKDAKRPLQMTCFVQKRDQSINQSINLLTSIQGMGLPRSSELDRGSCIKRMTKALSSWPSRCLHKEIRYNRVSTL